MELKLTRAVGRESCPTGGAFLRQQLEAGGGAEAEEQEERSRAGHHDVSPGLEVSEVGLVQVLTQLRSVLPPRPHLLFLSVLTNQSAPRGND